MIGRDAVAHFFASVNTRYQISADDRVPQFAPLYFDASVEEIFLSLYHCARLILRNDQMLESLPRFLQGCARLQISVLDLPTTFWNELVFCISQPQAALPGSAIAVVDAVLRAVAYGAEGELCC